MIWYGWKLIYTIVPLSHHGLEEVAPPHLPVGEQLEVLEVQALLQVVVALVLVGVPRDERLQEPVDLSGQPFARDTHAVHLQGFVSVLRDRLARPYDFTASVHHGRVH